MKKCGKNWTTQNREDTPRYKTVAWSCDTDELPAHATANTVLGSSWMQERSRSANDKLERQSQETTTKVVTKSLPRSLNKVIDDRNIINS